MFAMKCVLVAAIVCPSIGVIHSMRRHRSVHDDEASNQRSACESVTTRVSFDTATTYGGDDVHVHAGGRAMETTSCARENEKCRGVRESIDTFCKTDYGFRPAMVRVPADDGEFKWQTKMIKVPTACSCYYNATQLRNAF